MNRLQNEKSPYLRQHADNPVDWYPWGQEALEKASREDKPVFLSIGYSTCHWCHVMAHESFEDREVAELLNRDFISVKVDREERPDLDSLYMTVCHLLTGSGGWPLSIFMTPDKQPFFAGTYFPRESRFGRMGMKEILNRLGSLWKNRREEVLRSAAGITKLLREEAGESREKAAARPGPATLEEAYEELTARFDRVHGGFGQAPKFPTAHNHFFLLRYWKRTGEDAALAMVEKTLQAMRRGGIYDHVGFGFHRYSVDAEWFLPHFEKMLYDQALLAMVYTEARQATGKDEYGKTAEEIMDYVLRDMTSPGGGFYSGEDADSEGAEGKFYLWREDEIRGALTGKAADLWIRAFNVEKEGNFSEDAGGRASGENILHLRKGLAELARALRQAQGDNLGGRELAETLEDSRRKLFLAREKRIHPHKDDKILTDWNGLMIAALAKGAQVLGRKDFAGAARRAADFLLLHLRNPAGRLLHRYRDGESAITAFLDDYAFLIWGLIDLYETLFEASYLEAALDLNEELFRHFRDKEGGAFFFTADDGEELPARRKEFSDGALPSGNSAMALNLLRLGRITGNPDLEQRADEIIGAFAGPAGRMPSAYTQFLTALDFAVGPSCEIVIAGDARKTDTEAMMSALRNAFIPNKVVLFHPSVEPAPGIPRLAPYAAGLNGLNGKATAYVCRAGSCRQPTTDIQRMMEILNGKE